MGWWGRAAEAGFKVMSFPQRPKIGKTGKQVAGLLLFFMCDLTL